MMITMEQLIMVLRNAGAMKESDILPTDRLREDLMLNSLGMMLVLVSLEQQMKLSLDPAGFQGIQTVEDLMEMLRNLKEGKV